MYLIILRHHFLHFLKIKLIFLKIEFAIWRSDSLERATITNHWRRIGEDMECSPLSSNTLTSKGYQKTYGSTVSSYTFWTSSGVRLPVEVKMFGPFLLCFALYAASQVLMLKILHPFMRTTHHHSHTSGGALLLTFDILKTKGPLLLLSASIYEGFSDHESRSCEYNKGTKVFLCIPTSSKPASLQNQGILPKAKD